MNFDKECEEIKAKLEDINTRLMEYVKGYTDGYEEAAKDPKAWYVLDKNGEQVHIRDAITLSNGAVKKIKALGYGGGCSTNTTWIDLSKCEKIKHDTREKIKEDLFFLLYGLLGDQIDEKLWKPEETASDVAEKFISRIEALGGE